MTSRNEAAFESQQGVRFYLQEARKADVRLARSLAQARYARGKAREAAAALESRWDSFRRLFGMVEEFSDEERQEIDRLVKNKCLDD